MGALHRLDEWLIDKAVAPVAHKIEHATGINNFVLANYLLGGMVAADAVRALNEQTAVNWFVCAAGVLIAAVRYVWVIFLERRIKKSGLLRNDERVLAQTWRIMQSLVMFIFYGPVLLFWSFGSGVSILSFCGCLSMWLHLYLAACDRPPPQQVREPVFGKLATGTN